MDEIRKALERIYKRDGSVTASAVVDAASKESSPLHNYFTWDDSEAAHQYRLTQARTLIKRVRVIAPDGVEEQIFHVPSITRGEGEYQIRSVVVSQPDAYERAMAAALSDLASAQENVDELR